MQNTISTHDPRLFTTLLQKKCIKMQSTAELLLFELSIKEHQVCARLVKWNVSD